MKSKFNLEKYKSNVYVMNCETLEEAQIFEQILDEDERRYNNGDLYNGCIPYKEYGSECCYAFNSGFYADVEYYMNGLYIILSFSDFDWSDYGYIGVSVDEDMSIITDDINCFIDNL